MLHRAIRGIALAIVVGLLPACGGLGSGTGPGQTSGGGEVGGTATADGAWAWMAGSSQFFASGSYGTLGVPASANTPGARYDSASCVGAAGEFWLFGGAGQAASGTGLLNDLWKFDGTRWIWVSGSSGSQALGSYGVRGTASPTNVPGARWRARLQGDFSGNLWLFGGMTVSGGQLAALDDLWKFNGTEWTWVAGSSTPGAPATYHAPGVSSASYTPGARFNAASWIDPAGAFWVFGGRTVGADGRESTLGDLWKHDGSGWAWVSGSSTANQAGVYGTLGVAAPQNTPGARANATACADPSGKVWLFGGEGILSSGVGPLSLNELWMFDGTRWTWVSGSNTAPQPAVYGTRGEAAPGNTPGARAGSSLWSDGQGGLWLFGGFGYGNAIGSPEDAGKSFFGNLNDLWKFDGTQWTWIGGHNYANQPGLYGTLGTPSSQNLPGARVPAGFWRDSSGKLWIFGGISQDASMQSGTLNDLWRYSP